MREANRQTKSKDLLFAACASGNAGSSLKTLSSSKTNSLCHPERSLAIREANRKAKSKDPVPTGAIIGDTRNSRFTNRISLLVTALLIASALSSRAQTSRNFPGPKPELTSPNGRYAIQNVDHNAHYHHFLFLKDKTTGKSRQVYEYGRGASVVWSPDSHHFAIDDGAGSDYTETKILSVEEGLPEIDVQKEIEDKAQNVPGGHHEYFYVAYWIDPRRVVVYHWGYGGEAPSAFCECYVYRLNGLARRCARQPRDSDRACQLATP
jgi:hypothetical protein